jgi:hypothetical protein
VDDLCDFLRHNRRRKFPPTIPEEISEPLPVTIKHQLDLDSRRIIAEFLQGYITQNLKRAALKLRKSLLQENPQTPAELEAILEKFKAALAKLQ